MIFILDFHYFFFYLRRIAELAWLASHFDLNVIKYVSKYPKTHFTAKMYFYSPMSKVLPQRKYPKPTLRYIFPPVAKISR